MTDALSPADDLLHPPASDDRWWTETYWYSFDQPGADVSATIYPLFRPNLGVCSLGVFVWDASAHEPWAVPYARNYWHLRMPSMPATELDLEGLSYRCVEPLRRYQAAYADPGLLEFDLEFTGLRDARPAFLASGVGHFDQPCRVVGTVSLRGARLDIDTLGMRDRTWSPRPEDRRGARTGYTYGTASADEQFLVLTTLDGNEGSLSHGVFNGYLVRAGAMSPLVAAKRSVVERRDGYPLRIELEATDALGRTLQAVGTTRNRLANQATPAQFAWMSMTSWEVSGGPAMIGEDQEVWSPDMLGGRLRDLTEQANRGSSRPDPDENAPQRSQGGSDDVR